MSKEAVKYDEHGNKTEVITYKSNGSIDEQKGVQSEYQYDSAGNVTRKTDYKMKGGKKVAVQVVEKEISYY